MAAAKMSGRDRLKYSILILSILLLSGTLFLGNSIRAAGTGRLAVQSTLLNPRYLSSVTRITLGQQELELRSAADSSEWYWYDPASDAWYLADGTKVTQLLALLSGTDSFTVASEQQKDWNALGVGAGQGDTVIVRGADGTVFSSLTFGFPNAAGTHIAVRSDRKDTVYLVSNRYGSWLAAGGEFWNDGSLLPRLSADAVSSVAWETADYTYRFYPGEKRYDSAVQLLAGLSGGRLVSPAAAEAGCTEKVLSVTAGDGLDWWELALFKTEEGQYIAQCLSPWDSKYVTVSKWTAQRLFI